MPDAPDNPPSRIWDESDVDDLRSRLVMFFEKRPHRSRAEDLADEVILRIIIIVNRLSSTGLREHERKNEILMSLYEKLSADGSLAGDKKCAHDLARYAFGVAKKVAQEETKKGIPWQFNSDETFEESKHDYDASSKDEKTLHKSFFPEEPEDLVRECLDECLRSLPEDKRELLLKYYETDNKKDSAFHQELADEFSITRNNLHVAIHRARERVRKCFLSCMERKQPGSSNLWCKD